MRRVRLAAACAAMLTALLLQASVVGPVLAPIPASLPAVLVAAVALVDGPGVGISFGFVCGLAADLGSDHPAGVLALSWLGVGVAAGLLADRRSIRANALATAVICAAAAALAGALLAVVAGHAAPVPRELALAGLADGVLALAVVPLVRVLLHTPALRAPQPVAAPELSLDSDRG